ncbi:(S)-benzoin forming benzil reductase [Metabacillus sp. KIGAM252]|uniref:(S)-benzoin forming benzil reductase n=1 Tax=Metabacillus flavus TaxID=2823519 RepID=A0ABS5LET2_9BACI|nr:(S)-benzoin forming benzil reductase [Metabacillus flavus]MBS2969221.1 (S)-benzoin forming benzil reductase [Metabacillus flavus]
MKTFIITGTSRGLGEELASQLLKTDHYVICLSRSKSGMLKQKAEERKAPLLEIQADLTAADSIPDLMEHIFSSIPAEGLQGIYLLNNAGTVQPVAPAELASAGEMVQNISINLIAPMVLTAEFIKRTADIPAEKRIMNISSGAARNSYEGWSSYCSAKAGLDHFSRCIAEEQKHRENGIKCVSIAPGVVDTSMQEHIRSLEEGRFPQQAKFIKLKKEGKLYSPTFAAEKLLTVLFDDQFGSEVIMDIRGV